MHDMLQPLIHKAQVHGLRIHVGRAGLCLGDTAEAVPPTMARWATCSAAPRAVSGLLVSGARCWSPCPAAARILMPEITEGRPLRLRHRRADARASCRRRAPRCMSRLGHARRRVAGFQGS